MNDRSRYGNKLLKTWCPECHQSYIVDYEKSGRSGHWEFRELKPDRYALICPHGHIHRLVVDSEGRIRGSIKR